MNTLRTYTLNGQMVWQGRLNKINGQHLPQPTGYIIRPLHRGDASSMGELSADIYRHLNPGEECFILIISAFSSLIGSLACQA